MENIDHERERWREFVEKEAREKYEETTAKTGDKIDLTAWKNERALKGAYGSFAIPGARKADINNYFDQTKPHI